MTHRIPHRAAALAALILSAVTAPAQAMTYHEVRTLSEPLGHTWPAERVHVDLEVRHDKVAASTFAATLNEEAPVPVQVEVLEGEPSAVRKVRVWVKVTLEKREELPLRITYNDEGRAAKQPDAGPVASVTKGKDDLVLSTGVAEVRLGGDAAPRGRKAVPFGDLPPLLAARPTGTQGWPGEVAWMCESPVRRRRVQVMADGPVWAEVRIHYELADKDRSYDVTVRGTAGEPWVDVIETYRLPKPSRAVLRVAGDLAPERVLWMPWFTWKDGRVHPTNQVLTPPLAEAAGDRPFATLRPRWSQRRDSSPVCLAVGEGGEAAPCLGALMTGPADWANPYEQMPTARADASPRVLEIQFPLGEGARHWAVIAGSLARLDDKGKLQTLMRRLGDIPLDRVLNEWVFDWKRNPKDPAPHILTTWPRLQAIREAFQAGRDTPEVRALRAVLDGKAKGDAKLAAFLAGERDGPGGGNPGAGIYLQRGYQDDFLNPTTYPRRLAGGVRRADLAAAGHPAGDAGTALIGYVFSDLNYWPGYTNGWGVGNPNFHTDMYKLALYAAAMLPDHPHARRWMAFGQANLRDDVRKIVFLPGGAGVECPGYHAYAFGHIVEMMQTIQNSGLEDPFTWPEVKATTDYLRRMHTPVDPRLGRRSLASIGDTHPWQGGTGRLFGMVAAGMAKTDPAFARACMAMYRHYYGDEGTGDLVDDVLLVDRSLEAGDLADLDWSSAAFPGFGAVLRSRFGTDRETFLTMKCGPARGHYQGDELSIHVFGAGRPLALDWHCGYKPRPDQEHMHNRVNLGDNENMDAVGKVLAFASTDAADCVAGEVRSDRLRKMPRYAHEIVWQATYPRRELARPATYRRLVMLVKHPKDSAFQDYVVFRDELDTDEPATFNLFTLSRGIRREGRLFRFDGQLDTDAVLYLAAPAKVDVATDRWSWPKQDDSSRIPEDFRVGENRWTRGEWQPWLRLSAAPGQDFLTVLYPFRKGEPVPRFETLADGRGVKVTLGKESEEVYLATDAPEAARGQAVVVRGNDRAVILTPGTLEPMGEAK